MSCFGVRGDDWLFRAQLEFEAGDITGGIGSNIESSVRTESATILTGEYQTHRYIIMDAQLGEESARFHLNYDPAFGLEFPVKFFDGQYDPISGYELSVSAAGQFEVERTSDLRRGESSACMQHGRIVPTEEFVAS